MNESDELAERLAGQLQRQRAVVARDAADDSAFGRAVRGAEDRAVAAQAMTIDREAQRAAWRSALVHAGVLGDLADVAVGDAIEGTTALEALRGELHGGARFVVLSGGVGVGKSVAAAYWLRRMVEQHGRAWMRWLHGHQLARVASFDQAAAQDELERVDFLVLDDLGMEYLDARGFLAALIDSLVYQRHGNRRLTVATTNLPAADFKARYGERVADRIRECGAFVHVAGASKRGRTVDSRAAS